MAMICRFCLQKYHEGKSVMAGHSLFLYKAYFEPV